MSRRGARFTVIIGVAYPLGLLLLAFVLLPFLSHGQTRIAYSSLSQLPVDRLSDLVNIFLKLAAAASIVAIVLGVSGLQQAEETVERIGQGAHSI
jgi:mxaC protein